MVPLGTALPSIETGNEVDMFTAPFSSAAAGLAGEAALSVPPWNVEQGMLLASIIEVT